MEVRRHPRSTRDTLMWRRRRVERRTAATSSRLNLVLGASLVVLAGAGCFGCAAEATDDSADPRADVAAADSVPLRDAREVGEDRVTVPDDTPPPPPPEVIRESIAPCEPVGSIGTPEAHADQARCAEAIADTAGFWFVGAPERTFSTLREALLEADTRGGGVICVQDGRTMVDGDARVVVPPRTHLVGVAGGSSTLDFRADYLILTEEAGLFDLRLQGLVAVEIAEARGAVLSGVTLSEFRESGVGVAGIDVVDSDEVTITDVVIPWSSAGIRCSASAGLSLLRSRVDGRGSAYFVACAGEVRGNLFRGAPLSVGFDSPLAIENNAFDLPGRREALYAQGTRDALVFRNNLVLGTETVLRYIDVRQPSLYALSVNNAFDSSAPAYVWDPQVPGEDDVVALPEHDATVRVSPSLSNPTAADYRPCRGSLLIDGGDPSLDDADGSRVDIGAFGGHQGGPSIGE